MAEQMVVRVSRAQVERAARLAIRRVTRRKKAKELSSETRRELMRHALEDREFALGDWMIEERCGCLVGNLLGGDPHDVLCDQGDVKDYDALCDVGMEFDDLLFESLSPGQQARCDREVPAVARVFG